MSRFQFQEFPFEQWFSWGFFSVPFCCRARGSKTTQSPNLHPIRMTHVKHVRQQGFVAVAKTFLGDKSEFRLFLKEYRNIPRKHTVYIRRILEIPIPDKRKATMVDKTP